MFIMLYLEHCTNHCCPCISAVKNMRSHRIQCFMLVWPCFIMTPALSQLSRISALKQLKMKYS